MATIAQQNVRVAAGVAVTFVAASAGGDRVRPGSNVYLLLRNGSASPVTVTVDATGVVFNGQPVPDTALAVAAAAEALIPITQDYAAASDGLAAVTYSAVTSVTVAVLTV